MENTSVKSKVIRSVLLNISELTVTPTFDRTFVDVTVGEESVKLTSPLHYKGKITLRT